MTEHVMTEDEARPLLSPHLAKIRECIEDGWAEWHRNTVAAPSLTLARKTTRANVVYDHITARLQDYFETCEIPTSRKRGFLTASLGEGRIIVRMKKFNHPTRLTTSGIPTAQRLAIEHQQVALDGLVPTYITVGYHPDELGIGLDVVAVACSYGKQLIWHIDLRDDGTVQSQPVSITPADDSDGPAVRSTKPRASEGVAEAN